MIDIFEAENRIGEYFVELGLVAGDDDDDAGGVDAFALDWPLHLVTRHDKVECTATIYEDYRGFAVLALEADVITVDDDDALRRWASTRAVVTFAKPRLDPTSDGRVRVVAVHHLFADAVTRASLECAVNAVGSAAVQWLRVLDEGGVGSHSSAGSAHGAERLFVGTDAGLDLILAEIDAMVGLGPVKSLVKRLVSVQKVAALRARNGLKALRPSPHLVFTGNPGTGKTTVARHIGRIYRELGVLSQGHVVEVDQSDLVAGYVGQTALKTKSALESARGGVLFVDEAYSLVGEGLAGYGDEAIETILTHMENHRGDLVVVVAGYPEQMRLFMECNPGLASRFDFTLDFPDFTNDELEQILRGLIAGHDYQLADDAVPAMRSALSRLRRGRGFGNAREIRKVFHDAVAAHSEWVVSEGVTSGPRLGLLSACHFGALGAPVRGTGSSTAAVPSAGYL